MKLTRFEEIESWKEARKTVSFVYGATIQNNWFQKDFRLLNQTQSTAVSAMFNFAEGFSCRSNEDIA